MQETMKTVVGIVNLIRGRAINPAAFDAEYGDVLFYNSVRWLCGAVLGDECTGSASSAMRCSANLCSTLRQDVVMRIWIPGYESYQGRTPGPFDEQTVG